MFRIFENLNFHPLNRLCIVSDFASNNLVVIATSA